MYDCKDHSNEAQITVIWRYIIDRSKKQYMTVLDCLTEISTTSPGWTLFYDEKIKCG